MPLGELYNSDLGIKGNQLPYRGRKGPHTLNRISRQSEGHQIPLDGSLGGPIDRTKTLRSALLALRESHPVIDPCRNWLEWPSGRADRL